MVVQSILHQVPYTHALARQSDEVAVQETNAREVGCEDVVFGEFDLSGVCVDQVGNRCLRHEVVAHGSNNRRAVL